MINMINMINLQKKPTINPISNNSNTHIASNHSNLAVSTISNPNTIVLSDIKIVKSATLTDNLVKLSNSSSGIKPCLPEMLGKQTPLSNIAAQLNFKMLQEIEFAIKSENAETSEEKKDSKQEKKEQESSDEKKEKKKNQ